MSTSPKQPPYVPIVCYCKGAYLCDMHRPKPEPPPYGACILCGHIEPAFDLIENHDRYWHLGCARDNS